MATSSNDVLDVAMPEYAFDESENQFLEAVRRGDVEQVETYFAKLKSKATAATEEDDGKESRLGGFALVLAAQNDNYEIVKLLLARGYTIDEPHARSCECKDCKSMGGLIKTLTRLNTYRALASPVYLSLSYLVGDLKEDTEEKLSKAVTNNDPIYRAFVLNGKFEKMAQKEYEFEKDYHLLSRRCEEYAVALLNLCRNMSEIECVMTMPVVKGMHHVLVKTSNKDAKKLSVLNFAIKNKNEKVRKCKCDR